jgi:hypothetical protein
MNIELPQNFDFFERTLPNTTIEQIIYQQGSNCIKRKLTEYDFGFIYKPIKTKTHQMQTRQDKNFYSFVLCKLFSSPYLNNVVISLVYSRTNTKYGEKLLELVEKYSLSKNYNCLSILDIGDARLSNWYLSQGYLLRSDKPYRYSNLNAYLMEKYI